MLTVGVAIRLGIRPADVLGWPLSEVHLVAAYCELEQEDFKSKAPPSPSAGAAPPPPPGGARVHTERVRKVFVVKPKQKER